MDGDRTQLRELGRTARHVTPRSAHAGFTPAADRDVVDLLCTRATDRDPDLLPIRWGRMLASPFAFLRGSAEVMAADLATTPRSGLSAQLCGDAHLANFGLFATPERTLVFDLNDFDETLPGPWEWDVKRLAVSVDVAARERSVNRSDRARLVTDAVATYRRAMADYADLRAIDVWYARVTADDALASVEAEARRAAERTVARARRKDHLRAFDKLVTVVDGRPRIADDPPLVTHDVPVGADVDIDAVAAVVDGYRASLPPEQRLLAERYRLVDVARKVVGVGSVGTRAYVALLMGAARPDDDPLILQVKEAGPSVLDPYCGPSTFAHHGERVVVGQRVMQAATGALLGWTTGPAGREFYVRQLWDQKGSVDLSVIAPGTLGIYAELCARVLARAHARSGQPAAIAAYLGSGDRFDRSVAAFAADYGDQTERDHAALAAAVRAGRLHAEVDG